MHTRIEKVEIKIVLDKSAYDRHRQDVEQLCPHTWQIGDSDTIKLNYKFDVSYLGEIQSHFLAIERLLDDKSIIRHTSVKELIHGKSLILSIAEKLTRIIDRLQPRSVQTKDDISLN